jgi:TolB-like protein
MNRMIRCKLAAIVIVLGASIGLAVEKPKLVRVYFVEKGSRPVVGELIREDADHLLIHDFRTGGERKVDAAAVREIKRDITEESAYATTGLPNLIAWQIKRAMPLASATGKIAKLDQSTIYVNLGNRNGIEQMQELWVYRGTSEVRDPDTNEVLDRQRRLIGKLKVTEVREAISKCNHFGEIEAEYQIGDEVESKAKIAVAVFPFTDESGNDSSDGNQITEDMTTGLSAAGIPMVERTRLVDALTELAIQQTELFSPESAQKVGKQIGATAVLVGTVSDTGQGLKANVRLVRASTGEILFARNHSLPASSATTAGSAGNVAPQVAAGKVAIGNVLTSLDLENISKKNNWQVNNGQLFYTGNGLADGLITFSKQLPKEFTLTVEATPKTAVAPVCLAFYFKASGSEFIVQLASDGSCLLVDGKDPRSNKTAKYDPVFVAGKPNTIVYQTRKGSLVIKVNGKEFLQYKDARFGSTPSDDFTFGVVGDWRFSKITVGR